MAIPFIDNCFTSDRHAAFVLPRTCVARVKMRREQSAPVIDSVQGDDKQKELLAILLFIISKQSTGSFFYEYGK